MFLGMHFVNGDFLPHKPDISIKEGMLPIADDNLIEEAITTARNSLKLWETLNKAGKKTIFNNLMEDFVRSEFAIKFPRLDKIKQLSYFKNSIYFEGKVILVVNSVVASAFGQIISAIFSGNSVIYKTSENSAMDAQKLTTLLRDHLPLGMYNMLHGDENTANKLINHKNIDCLIIRRE